MRKVIRPQPTNKRTSAATKCARIVAYCLLLFAPLFASVLTVRAMSAWNSLLRHGETIEASSFGEVTQYSQNLRGGTSAYPTYLYTFSYRGIRYVETSRVDNYYLGDWPSAPYRVTFLPNNPEINEILPVSPRYVVCKSVRTIFYMVLITVVSVLPLWVDSVHHKTPDTLRSHLNFRRKTKTPIIRRQEFSGGRKRTPS